MIIMIILMVLAAVAVSTLLVQVCNLRKKNIHITQKAVLDLHTSFDGRCGVRASQWGQCPHCVQQASDRLFFERYEGIIEDSLEESRLKQAQLEYEQAYDDAYATWDELLRLVSESS